MKKGYIVDKIDIEVRNQDKEGRSLKFKYLGTDIRR